MPTQSWSHLKSHLQRLEKEDLVQILRDLYRLNPDNKVFLATRFLSTTPEEMAEPYRKIVRQVFNPDGRGHPSLQLGVARKALNDFKKACADPIAVIEFMLFYVEQGVICTNTYGDIDAPFYNSLFSVYRSATELVAEIDDPAVIEPLHARFLTIIRDSDRIGWGFYDGIVEVSAEILEAEWA